MAEYSARHDGEALEAQDFEAPGAAHDYRDDDRRPKQDFEAAVAPEPVGRVTAPPALRAPTGPSPQPAPVASTPAPPAAAQPKAKRSLKRPLLFALLPVALIVGAYWYVVGGQIVATDNAYVQAQMLGLSTDVSGTVVDIPVHNNQHVARGEVMFRIRPDAFKVALDGAVAQLGTVRNQVLTLQASYAQSLAAIKQAEADVPYYQSVFDRQKDLVATHVASKAIFDQAEHDLTSAQQRLVVARAQAQSMLAQLGGDAAQPVEQNPFYLQAKSLVDNAQRDLNDTVVKAPFDGIVTKVDQLQVGTYLPAAQAGFMLVSDTNLWIEASPKETELTWVRPGQAVTVTVDTYPGQEWQGSVESINPASGSSFSLLPAQNTTGNWVKVVQRNPMRIRLDGLAGKPPLRVGMSAVVAVDTGHARGIPDALKPAAAYLLPYYDRFRRFAAERLHVRV